MNRYTSIWSSWDRRITKTLLLTNTVFIVMGITLILVMIYNARITGTTPEFILCITGLIGLSILSHTIKTKIIMMRD